MDIETLWELGMSFPFASSRNPFGPDTLSMEVGGKMFALLDLSGESEFYNIKVDSEKGVELRDKYACIRPAYHMNKDKWISVDFHGGLPESMHRRLLIDSYREVLRGMSRVKRNKVLDFDIRPAEERDIPRMLELFTAAKAYMRRQGNMVQWMGDYPGEAAIRGDMNKGWSMVVEHCGEVVGTFCMMTDPEPTYHTLPTTEPYQTLHRVASDGSVAGIVDAAVRYALACDGAVRIDTHPDNQAMLKCIRRLKMKRIGEIELADGTPRVVFELLSNA